MSHWVQDAGRNHEYETKALYERFIDEYNSKLGYYNFNGGLEDYCKLFGIEYESTTGTSGALKNKKIFVLRSDQPEQMNEEDLPF